MRKIVASKRAAVAIAAVVAASIGGMVAIFGGTRVPDDVALAVTALVQPWEGRRLNAYLDKVARPPVWTICDGDTQNVKAGMVETPAGCDKRLIGRLMRDFRPKLVTCIAGFDKKPLSWRAMMNSLSWNIGTGAACKSTAARLGREGKYHESCIAATVFNRAGGQMIIGLVNRRTMGDAKRIGEAELCVTGLTAALRMRL